MITNFFSSTGKRKPDHVDGINNEDTSETGLGSIRSLITITILITGHIKLLITITIMII
jgi:hypothetical protein